MPRIETKLLAIRYPLASYELAEKIYHELKGRIKDSKIKSLELVEAKHKIYVDGHFFNNIHVPYGEYEHGWEVEIGVADEDKDEAVSLLKNVANIVLPTDMKVWGLALVSNHKEVITETFE